MDREAAWDDLLAEMGLTHQPELLKVRIEGGAPELEVSLLSLANEELTFSDGLYGATAYTFTGERWERVDTAEIRTTIAPLLAPGEEATFRLPVKEADFYRVLFPAQGRAAWGDSG